MIPSLLDNNDDDDDDDDDDDERRSEMYSKVNKIPEWPFSSSTQRETYTQKVEITRQRTIWKDYKIMPPTKTKIKRSKCIRKKFVPFANEYHFDEMRLI
jgi:hypothetical protein